MGQAPCVHHARIDSGLSTSASCAGEGGTTFVFFTSTGFVVMSALVLCLRPGHGPPFGLVLFSVSLRISHIWSTKQHTSRCRREQ